MKIRKDWLDLWCCPSWRLTTRPDRNDFCPRCGPVEHYEDRFRQSVERSVAVFRCRECGFSLTVRMGRVPGGGPGVVCVESYS